MDSYINSLGVDKTKYAILIFSFGREQDWKQISRLAGNLKREQQIIWIALSPSSHVDIKMSNQHAIEKIVHIIRACSDRSGNVDI